MSSYAWISIIVELILKFKTLSSKAVKSSDVRDSRDLDDESDNSNIDDDDNDDSEEDDRDLDIDDDEDDGHNSYKRLKNGDDAEDDEVVDDSGSGEDDDFDQEGEDEVEYDDTYDHSDDDDYDIKDYADTEYDGSGLQWKQGMKNKASNAFLDRLASSSKSEDLMTKVYGKNWMTSGGHHDDYRAEDDNIMDDDRDEDDDLFQLNSVVTQSRQAKYDRINALDSNRAKISQNIIDRWSLALKIKSRSEEESTNDDYDEEEEDKEDVLEAKLLLYNIRNKFVTGDWSKANKVQDSLDDEGSEYGDFEDLETGKKYSGKAKMREGSDAENSDEEFDYGSDENDSDEDDEEDVDSEAENDDIDRKLREENMKRKAVQKESFDKEYDESKQISAKDKADLDAEEAAALEAIKKKYEEQQERNRKEFGEDGEQTRFQYEGYRQGIYVRVLIQNVPMEFTESFRSETPIVLGGILLNLNFEFFDKKILYIFTC